MEKYATFTSCTQNYVSCLVAQLNSMDYYDHNFDVHILAIDIDEDFLRKLENKEWSFNLIIHRTSKADIDYVGDRVPKKIRYKFISDHCQNYDAVLFLDVDILFVSNITRFLDLVNGTPYLIGCNEKFKWAMNNYYLIEEDSHTSLPKIQMEWMVCNSPIFMSPKFNKDFWSIAWDTSLKLMSGMKNKPPSDLFTMNVAIWRANIQDRVILLPSYAWIGNHNGYFNIYTRIVKKQGKWKSMCGEPVYMIHGRWDKDGSENYYVNEQEKRYRELKLSEDMKNKYRNKMRDTIEQIKAEHKFFREMDEELWQKY